MKIIFNPLTAQFQLAADEARDIRIEDAGKLYDTNNVENALQEIALRLMYRPTGGGSSGSDDSKVDVAGDTMTGDLIGTDFIATRSGTITRSGGKISEVAKAGGRTIIITRTGDYISSITDGTRTWTFTRDGNNAITAWTVT